MELPDDVLGLIREFSQPLCRLDWRKGSYAVRHPNFGFELVASCVHWQQRHLTNEAYYLGFIVDALDVLEMY
jgi:hypothetical protein